MWLKPFYFHDKLKQTVLAAFIVIIRPGFAFIQCNLMTFFVPLPW